MIGLILFGVYVAGWLVACHVLARFFPWEFAREGLLMLGLYALVWPFLALVGLFVLLVRLVTWGLDV